MQNTRWLTRNTLRCWWWWYDGGGSKKEEERQRAKIISSLRKREENDVLREEEGLSIILRLFCGQMRLSRGDCLARWWWWWWWCFLSFVSLMSDERFWKINQFLSTHLLLFSLWRRKRKRKRKRWNDDVPLLGSRITQNTTLFDLVCVYVLIILLWEGI